MMSTQRDIVRFPSSSDSHNVDYQGGVAAAPAKNVSCRNSGTEPTGQLTGSTAWTKQYLKTFHLEE